MKTNLKKGIGEGVSTTEVKSVLNDFEQFEVMRPEMVKGGGPSDGGVGIIEVLD